MKNHIVLCIIAVLAGCTTGYKPHGIGGGYEDVELSPGYFRVSVRGNGVTSVEKVNDLALLRASDLIIAKGCPSFKVINSKNSTNSSYYQAPVTQTTNANASLLGNYMYGSATTTTYGGELNRIDREKTSLEVQCSAELPNPSEGIYDAKFINKSLKIKYQIK